MGAYRPIRSRCFRIGDKFIRLIEKVRNMDVTGNNNVKILKKSTVMSIIYSIDGWSSDCPFKKELIKKVNWARDQYWTDKIRTK